MRSRQFDDFPSNWSEAIEIEFVVLRRPREVQGLEIDFDTVNVVCRDNETFLEVEGEARWSETTVSGGIELEYYELSVNNLQLTIFVSCGHISVCNIYKLVATICVSC